MTEELTIGVIIVGILASGIRLATPYLFATIGEALSQLSGVLNLGVEGIMLMAAFAAFYTVVQTDNYWLALFIAILVGGLMGLFMALVSVTLKAEQGISGIGLFLFGLGMSDLLFQATLNEVQQVEGIPALNIPILSDLPVVGPILFSQNLMTYAAFALVPIAWFVINKTTLGLKIMAVGQNPAAADSLGISVSRVRYLTVTVGGILGWFGRCFALHCAAQCLPKKHDQWPRLYRRCPRLFWHLEARRGAVGVTLVQYGECPSALDSSPKHSHPFPTSCDVTLYLDDCGSGTNHAAVNEHTGRSS